MTNLFVILGCSSSGKDTITKRMLSDEQFKIFNFKNIVDYTTRPMRIGEVNSKEHYFDNKDTFKKRIRMGFFAEYRKYRVKAKEKVWYYGTPKYSINKEGNFVLILDYKGLQQLKKYCKHRYNINIYSLFIYTDPYNRLLRSLEREKTVFKELSKKEYELKISEIIRRYQYDNKTIAKCINKCKYIIHNTDSIKCTMDEVYNILSNILLN